MRLLLAEDEKALSKALVAILDIMMPKVDGLTVLKKSMGKRKSDSNFIINSQIGSR